MEREMRIVANFLAAKLVQQNGLIENLRIYQYGIELILSTIISFIIVVIVEDHNSKESLELIKD